MNLRTLSRPVLYFLLILAAWGGFSLIPIDWSGWRPATCLSSGGCFCEAIRPGSTAQPANTWSSLLYLFPGLLVLILPRGAGLFDARPANRWIFGLTLGVIGLGSAFYHASLSFAGQFYDVLGMYLLISFATLYRLAQIARWDGRGMAGAYLITNLVLAGMLIGLPGVRREVFGGLIAVYLGLEAWTIARRRSRLQLRWLGWGLLSMAAAYGIWILDNQRILCAPSSLLQGHALWHALGALAAWLLFRYLVSEQ